MPGKTVSRKEARRSIARVKEALGGSGEVSHLNITAMMDMMTILLVFLLKQFSVTALPVAGSDQLQLAKSKSALKPQPAVNVTVTSATIIVEGEPVVSVRGGAVDSTAKRDGANGYYITPLVDTLQKHANRLKKIEVMSSGAAKFDGTLLLLVDRATPYRLVTEVLYSAGQAEFRNYRLVVASTSE